jgi:hypothetical protein
MTPSIKTTYYSHYAGLIRSINVLLSVVCVILSGVLCVELFLPVKMAESTTSDASSPEIFSATQSHQMGMKSDDPNKDLARIIRPGLFKSAAGLRDRPLADKTMENIRAKLTLQCIMPINNDLVAYINVSGLGLKSCRVGDAVADLFTVLNISKTEVEISIVEHKVTLRI